MSVAFITFALTTCFVLGSVGRATTVIVPDDSPTVQGGLNLLAPDDTLYVRLGVYSEALVAPGLPFVMLGELEIDSGTSLRPILDATFAGTPDSVPAFALPVGSLVDIENFHFKNTNRTGIFCMGSAIRLAECVVESTYIGIKYNLLDAGTHVTIQRCDFRRNFEHCVFVGRGNRLLMSDCDLSGAGSDNGRALVSASESIIDSCSFVGDEQAALLYLWDGAQIVRECRFGPVRSQSIWDGVVAEVRGRYVDVSNNSFVDCEYNSIVLGVRSGFPDSVSVCDNLFSHCRGMANSLTPRGVVHIWAEGAAQRGALLQENTFVDCQANSNVDDIQFVPPAPALVFENSFTRDALNGLPSIHAGNPDSEPTPVVLISNRWSACGYAVALSAVADARNNYWGHSSGPYHETTNPFGQGDTITGDVPFIPWLEDSTENADDRDPAIAHEFRLTCYPNPFNATVTIEFALSHEQTISMVIFDRLGRQVESLLNQRVPAGAQRVTWNAQAHSSGLYFARLSGSARASSTTTKLLLLK
ncbi:MAG: right-handed parallel beta-helix repeat-containing protein [bacterium]|nr:right-handed parallel beta-helix repeat-containing protein [bacterium]